MASYPCIRAHADEHVLQRVVETMAQVQAPVTLGGGITMVNGLRSLLTVASATGFVPSRDNSRRGGGVVKAVGNCRCFS